MCCIAICSKKKLTEQQFNQIWNKNPDGVGFAKYLSSKSLFYYKKGFMDKAAAFEFAEKLELPYTIHFRKSSIGLVCPELTHPFPIEYSSPLTLEGEAEEVLFQNGTNYNWDIHLAAHGIFPATDDKMWSDTRAIASIVSNNNHDYLRKISGKFVVGSKTNKRFIDYDTFIEEDGIYFSNTEWRYWTNTVFHKKKESGDNGCKKFSTNTSNLGNNISNLGNSYNYYISDRPWDKERNLIIKFLLNKISKNAAKKMWRKYACFDKDSHWLEEQAIKVLKQQDKNFNEDRIRKLLTNMRVAMQPPPKLLTDTYKLTNTVDKKQSIGETSAGMTKILQEMLGGDSD